MFGKGRSIDITVNLIRGAKFAAGMQAFHLIADAVSSVGRLSADAAVESVKLAASFERTQNSLRVYAGSLTAAGRELKAVETLAGNTPGLRLESAEKGYQRLRAVSFESERARKLLQGLSKEKVLSSADNQAIERVVFNFGQLKVGAQKFSQEVREILTQMPSLRRSFLDAFGTLNPQKIQAMFDTNPDAFFDKLSDSMAKTKNISSDTIDSFEKLQDEVIKAGREFGKPLLPGITKELQDLTAYLRANGDSWAEWGTFASDAIKGIKEDFSGLGNLLGRTEGVQYPVNDAITAYLRWSTGITALSDYFSDAAERGSDKTSSLVKEQAEKAKREAERIEEFRTEQANKEFERITKEELQRGEALRILDSYHKSRISILQNAFSVESALADAKPVFNLEQEKQVLERQTNLRSQLLKSQLSVETAFYNEQVRLNSDNKLELEKIEFERGKTLGKIQADIIVNQIKGQKELDRIDREIIQQKRAAIAELNQLSAQAAKQSLDTTSFNFDRSFTLGGYDAAAFNRFRDELGKSYSELTRLSSEFYRGQLLNESLTAEQRTNVLKQLNSEQTGLAEDLRRRMLDIGDRQYTAQIQQMESYGQAVRNHYQNLASYYGQIGASLFSPQNFGEDSLRNVQKTLLRQTDFADLAQKISEAQAAQANLRKQMDDLRPAAIGRKGLNGGLIFPTDEQTASYNTLEEAWSKLVKKSDELRASQEKLKETIPDLYYEFEKLAKQIEGGNVRAFDVAARKTLDARHQLEAASLQSEIDSLRTIDGKEGLIDLAARHGDLVKSKEYELRLSVLLKQQESQRLTQTVEQTDQARNSIDGLTQTLERLRAGNQAEITGFQYLAKQNILREQIGLFGEIIELQERLATVGQDSAERYQRAWLDATLAVKEANIQAVESQIESQVRLADSATLHVEQVRARVLSHLAEQKTLSESFADGIIKSFDKLTDFLNKGLGKVGDIPIIGDLLKFSNQNFASKLTNGLLDAFFPSEIKELFNKEKNPIAAPIVEQQKKTNDLLSVIANQTGASVLPTGGGIQSVVKLVFPGLSGGGTPNFNPNVSSGGGNPLQNLIRLFTGGGRSGGYGSNAPGVGIYTTPPFNPNFLNSGSTVGQPRGVMGDIRGAFQVPGTNTSIGSIFSSKPGGIFAPLEGANGQTSAMGGYLSGAGQLASFVGSLIGGKWGNVISATGSGLAMGAQIGTMILPGLGTAIGAAAGALAGFLSTIFQNPQRKKDEQLRSQYRDEAVSALMQLIDRAKRGDSGALSAGTQVINQYRTAVQALKDAKTRRIALNELNPPNIIWRKYEDLKEADKIGKKYNSAQLRPILPEFADGGFMDSGFVKQYQAYQQGYGILKGGIPGKDSIHILAQDGELFANKQQQRRINELAGFDVLSEVGFPHYPRKRQPIKMATGGVIGSIAPSVSASRGDIHVTVVMEGDIEARVKEITIREMGSEQGRKVTGENIKILRKNRIV